MSTTDHPLTVTEAAAALGCKKRHAEYLIASGELPSYKLGSLRRVRPEDIDAYLAALVEADADSHRSLVSEYRRRFG